MVNTRGTKYLFAESPFHLNTNIFMFLTNPEFNYFVKIKTSQTNRCFASLEDGGVQRLWVEGGERWFPYKEQGKKAALSFMDFTNFLFVEIVEMRTSQTVYCFGDLT